LIIAHDEYDLSALSRLVGWAPGVGNDEVDQLLALEELGTHLVALGRDDDQADRAAQGAVAPGQLAGVFSSGTTASASPCTWRIGTPALASGPSRSMGLCSARRAASSAVFPEPVRLECGPGVAAPGDWSKAGALECYSGGAWYRKTVTLSPEQARGGITLDLGRVVATAEVRLNGQVAGIRVAPPWRVDLSKHVKPGENRIEVLVFNTLANHYRTIPTNYRGELTSGLLGPVTLEVATANADDS
jgi:hypothetical protein